MIDLSGYALRDALQKLSDTQSSDTQSSDAHVSMRNICRAAYAGTLEGAASALLAECEPDAMAGWAVIRAVEAADSIRLDIARFRQLGEDRDAL